MSLWLPHPWMSALLLLVWLLLNNSISPGNLVLGALLALVLPRVTRAFWPERPHLQRPGLLLRYVLRLLADIVLANLVVARQVLGPPRRLHPAFIAFPLEVADPFAIALLTSTISLTPGTVSAQLSADHRTLWIHALDAPHPEAMVAHLKQRYEAPLQEIFR